MIRRNLVVSSLLSLLLLGSSSFEVDAAIDCTLPPPLELENDLTFKPFRIERKKPLP
jgi:hypothetical protein